MHVDGVTFHIDTPRKTVAALKNFFLHVRLANFLSGMLGGFCFCFDKILSGAGEGVIKLSLGESA